MKERIRAVLDRIGMLPTPVAHVSDGQDLYDAGLTSFGSVQLMLALEEEFDVEFPEKMLTRRTFSSVTAMDQALSELVPETV